MIFTETKIKGAWIIEPSQQIDSRGIFFRNFDQALFKAKNIDHHVAQGNLSENPRALTLRGMHYQKHPHWEAKTMTCISGAIFNVVIDLRPESPTFKQWISVEQSSKNRLIVHVPVGCASGWLTLLDHTSIHYSMSEAYYPELSGGIRYNDPAFGIQWPETPQLVSDRDLACPDFKV